MNSANQMAEEIYGLHCDIGRLEKLVKHWKNEFIDEQDYAKMMELEADKAKAENVKLRKLLSSALIVAGFKGRQYLDTYLTEEEGTTLWQELKGLGIEVDG